MPTMLIPEHELEELTIETCKSVFGNADTYDHSKTEGWNTAIISTLLERLIALTKPASGEPHPFKFVVNSTIIQQMPRPAPSSKPATANKDGVSEPSDQAAMSAGRRGMHAASGAYWNQEKDGMWSYKWEGLDFVVVVGVVWVKV